MAQQSNGGNGSGAPRGGGTPPGGDGSAPRKKLEVFAVPEAKDGEKHYWPRIGVAFWNRDGSLALYLDALPLGTNKLQVREARAPAEGRGNGHARDEFETVEVRS